MTNKSIIVFSGCDGSGKTTLIKHLCSSFLKNDKVVVLWLRYLHYTAKIINALGRFLGKSYYEVHNGEKFGYHNYEQSVLGYFYVVFVYIDYLLYRFLVLPFKLKGSDIVIVDRFTFDIVADLILDTRREELILHLFRPFLEKDRALYTQYIVTASHETIVKRRHNLIFDKVLNRKLQIYISIAEQFNITVLDTSEKNCQDFNNVFEKLIHAQTS